MKFFHKKRKKLIKTKSKDSSKMILFKQALVGLSIALFFGLLGTGMYYGSRVEQFTISGVAIVGGQTISHQEVKELVEPLLEGEYFKLVPRVFMFTYPHDAIIESVATKERIKNIHIEITKEKKLVVVFEEYRPIALWCEAVSSKECLFLDNDGYAFTEAPYLEGTSFMRYSDVARTPVVGLTAFPEEFIHESNVFVKNAYNSLGLNIIHVEQSSAEDVSYHVSGGGLIKTTLRMGTEETLRNLESILTSDEFAHIEPGNFQYIDLRFGNKIFVNEELESEEEFKQEKTATDTKSVADFE